MRKQEPELTFELALKRLEEIVGKLESGEDSLEASLQQFEEATKLAQFCQQQLKAAETKLQKLVEKRAGVFELEPSEDV